MENTTLRVSPSHAPRGPGPLHGTVGGRLPTDVGKRGPWVRAARGRDTLLVLITGIEEARADPSPHLFVHF